MNLKNTGMITKIIYDVDNSKTNITIKLDNSFEDNKSNLVILNESFCNIKKTKIDECEKNGIDIKYSSMSILVKEDKEYEVSNLVLNKNSKYEFEIKWNTNTKDLTIVKIIAL